jgi:O-antigen chain-terminating methyltransferase
MSNDFYRAFEDSLRGSRELIKNRLAVYLPFVEPLLLFYPAASAMDLGCGRGEWLETLLSSGFRPTGVDLDEGMLNACHEAGLDVIHDDAFAVLAALPDESQAIVSAFHMVEHIGFDQLQSLISNALRVLKPGGLLIMETPNPENIVVGTTDFYRDPTHLRPVPPLLLSFLAKFNKFSRVKTLGLNEPENLGEHSEVRLLDVFSGVSPDYAVIAQKQGESGVMTALDAVFDKDYGLSLGSLATRYDMQINAHIFQAEIRIQQADIRVQQADANARQAGEWAQQVARDAESYRQQADARIQQADAHAQQAEEWAQQVIRDAESYRQQADARVQQAGHEASVYRQQAESVQAQIVALRGSTSWRITGPLRGVKRALCGDVQPAHELSARIILKMKTTIRRALAHGIRYVYLRPRLRRGLSRGLKKFPALYQYLSSIGQNTGVVSSTASSSETSFVQSDVLTRPLQNLSPRAAQIHKILKTVAQYGEEIQ